MAAEECSGDCLAGSNNTTDGENYASVNDYELSFYVIFYKLTVPLLFSFISLFGITGNLLVIYVVLSTSDMRRNTVNILLLNLAVRSHRCHWLAHTHILVRIYDFSQSYHVLA